MIFIITGLSVLLAVLLLAILLSLKPDALKVLRPLVCRKDEKMEILFSVASHHQPSEKSIEIYCDNYGRRRLVNGKTLLFAVLFSFVLMPPGSITIVVLVDKLLLKWETFHDFV